MSKNDTVNEESLPEEISGLIEPQENGGILIETPKTAGAYRLFVYVYDGQGHAGHANLPFLVK